MNPLIVIVVFTAILAALLYYLQGREAKQRTQPVAEAEKPERNIVKASEYQAQYDQEKKEEVKEGPKQEPETPPEPVAEPVMEPEPEPILEPAKEESVLVEDISMLSGIGPKYQELLRAADFNTIKSISEETPEELFSKLLKVNEEQSITKRTPTLSNVTDWIERAKAYRV